MADERGEDDELGWLPADGARLTRDELLTVMRALRDLVRYTDEDQGSMFRLRVEEIGTLISDAIGREPGEGTL